jgi:hypothetical protein
LSTWSSSELQERNELPPAIAIVIGSSTIINPGGKPIDHYEISMKQFSQQVLPAGLAHHPAVEDEITSWWCGVSGGPLAAWCRPLHGLSTPPPRHAVGRSVMMIVMGRAAPVPKLPDRHHHGCCGVVEPSIGRATDDLGAAR